MSQSPARSTRAIELEVEVPGTPEEIWQAVATGPGITAWFVPTEVVEREGGDIVMHFGPGMDERGRVTAWEPPRRFAYEPIDGERRLAYEFVVQARSGGTCVVRLVNSGFGEGPDWDAEFDGMQAGWRLFLEILRLGRTHFPGRPCAPVLAGGRADVPRVEAFAQLTGALGLTSAQLGERAATAGDGVPPLAGTVAWTADQMLALVTDEPGPAVAFVVAEGSGARASVSVYLYCFGERGAAVAAEQGPAWRAWMAARFPPAGEPADGRAS